ncbi:hypothetical protein MSG28_010314 [Choristoneura fumiferana]|uniref:Uncharacterized protein n=2 Tax=Choristoneura fumiferana TaxID=7141 RepID=A0ACC0KL60_CHOFU|nr:hypothetical protein MSG28_010314 [Choristoneura fumiferana]
MALNKYMHPRNIYRTPPDFAKLSKDFAEFAAISQLDVTGKVTIDFKDPKSLRILTKCLLKSDFNLNVEIPEDRLVPTLPLRLNYILWIEDLLKAIDKDNNVRGLDIGTGACAIYPLLAAAKNKWQMVGTEADEESLSKAQNNVQINNLQELIHVKKIETTSIFNELFGKESEQKFHFSMCNPPFYSNIQELCESRSTARPPPKNGFTGSPHELITEGGELEFCRKMIKESKEHKHKIIIFTTMVGHKFNLEELLEDLKAEGLKHTNSEFCQGRVTRWGLAWTYQDYEIYKLVPPREKPRKKNVSTTYQLPELTEQTNNFETVHNKIKSILKDLQITHKVLNKRGNSLSIDIVATTNTWSNQRRKRRLMKRQESEQKKIKLDAAKEISVVNNNLDEKSEIPIASVSGDSDTATNTKSNQPEVDSIGEFERLQENQELVHAFIKIFMKQAQVILETEFLSGSSGKEGLHQIVQYIKNNWK